MIIKNSKILVLSMTINAVLVFAYNGAAYSHDGAEHTDTHEVSQDMLTNVDDLFSKIAESEKAIGASVASKELTKVHEQAMTLSHLVSTTVSFAPADKKVQIQGTVNNVAKITDELHDAADKGNLNLTEAKLKKLNGVISLLRTQFGHN